MTNQRFLTEQVFHFVSELYAYGLREVVISPVTLHAFSTRV